MPSSLLRAKVLELLDEAYEFFPELFASFEVDLSPPSSLHPSDEAISKNVALVPRWLRAHLMERQRLKFAQAFSFHPKVMDCLLVSNASLHRIFDTLMSTIELFYQLGDLMQCSPSAPSHIRSSVSPHIAIHLVPARRVEPPNTHSALAVWTRPGMTPVPSACLELGNVTLSQRGVTDPHAVGMSYPQTSMSAGMVPEHDML